MISNPIRPGVAMLALTAASALIAAPAQAQAPARGAVSAAAASAPAAPAQDRADIDRTKIIGNRELPKVLYIVPWKKPFPGDLSGRPMGGVLDEALAPVDRDVFRRQVQYDGLVKPAAAAPAAPAAPPK